MTATTLSARLSWDIEVAAPLEIAAPGALYEAALSQADAKNPEPELLPPFGRETALWGRRLTKTKEEESIINRPDKSTYPQEKAVSRSGATPILVLPSLESL
jgi:hypothetical protein